ERVEEPTAGDDDPYGVLPIPDLYKLRNALEYEITIAKETPYETVQSPVLKLTAKGASPAQAKLLVDTWAEECVHAAQRFQLARYKPSVDGFEQQTEAQLRKLEAVDNRVRDFWTSNNPELLEEQLNLLIGLARNYRESMWTVEQEIMQEQARAASLDAALEGEGPTLKLRWVPPQRLFQMVVAGAAAGDAPEGTQEDVLLMEQENPIHTRLATEAAIARASVAANEAKRRKLDELLVQIDEERADLQERSAAVELELERISRDSEVATSAYKNAVLKLEFARMAKALEEPGLQLLSKGAEWPLPRYRRAILFAAFSAFVGALTGMFVSVLHRLVLHPVLETVQ
ncbi:MAG TPA: hypothetical protein PKL84_12245, partial [Candidatus Hydrogenedentes bacterium]|nr:hypothetical protein [Candidatus Hydrogenedentota bacterium]